jgi:hypothetical protein
VVVSKWADGEDRERRSAEKAFHLLSRFFPHAVAVTVTTWHAQTQPCVKGLPEVRRVTLSIVPSPSHRTCTLLLLLLLLLRTARSVV